MKNKVLLYLLGCLCFLGMVSSSFGQTPGKWSSPQNHPCYQGIKISVMNMGYGKEGGGYMWGVRFTNFYKLSVSFKYKLTIGEKIVAASDGETCSNLGNGISKIDGRDKATAKIFQSPSNEWNLYIWDVCFSGMKCGGTNNCYAECDKQSGKENQLCGLMDDYKPTPGSNLPSVLSGKEDAPPAEVKTEKKGPASIWIRDDKGMKLVLQKSAIGLYATREGYTTTSFFKKIDDKTYRLEAGNEFFIIKFDGEKQFGYWNTGVLENVFTLDENPDNLSDLTVPLSTDEEPDSNAIKTNGDPYSFKGTTLWKRPNRDQIKEEWAFVNQQLYGVKGEGWPYEDFSKRKPSYKRVAPDTYKLILAPIDRKSPTDTLSWFYYKFISNNKLVDASDYKITIDTGYYKKGKRGAVEFIVTGKKDTLAYRGDTLILAETLTIESLPEASTEPIIIPDGSSSFWKNEKKDLSDIYQLKISINGDVMNCTLGSERYGWQTKPNAYKNASVNTYFYKTKKGSARLVLLSPNRICVSFVYGNFVSVGYYSKQAAPIIQ